MIDSKEYWTLCFKCEIIAEVQSICVLNFAKNGLNLKNRYFLSKKIPALNFLYNVPCNLFNLMVRAVLNSYAANFRNKDPKSPKNHEILQILKLRKQPILNCKDKYILFWLSVCNFMIWMQNYTWFYWTNYIFDIPCVFYAIKCWNITKNRFFDVMKWTKMEKIDFWLPW